MATERARRVPRCSPAMSTVPYTGQVSNPVLLLTIVMIDLLRPAVHTVSARPFYRLVVILVLMIVLVAAARVPLPVLPELPPLHPLPLVM
jgi:hypothetical protein